MRETVEHFLCSCPLYTNAREKAKQEIFLMTGISDFSEILFLTTAEKDPHEQWRRSLNKQLNDYIEATKRFGSRGPSALLV